MDVSGHNYYSIMAFFEILGGRNGISFWSKHNSSFSDSDYID